MCVINFTKFNLLHSTNDLGWPCIPSLSYVSFKLIFLPTISALEQIHRYFTGTDTQKFVFLDFGGLNDEEEKDNNGRRRPQKRGSELQLTERWWKHWSTVSYRQYHGDHRSVCKSLLFLKNSLVLPFLKIHRPYSYSPLLASLGVFIGLSPSQSSFCSRRRTLRSKRRKSDTGTGTHTSSDYWTYVVSSPSTTGYYS